MADITSTITADEDDLRVFIADGPSVRLVGATARLRGAIAAALPKPRIKVTRNGRTAHVHRLVAVHFHGPIPAGLVVDHTCHNADAACSGRSGECRHRLCLNPAHLRLVVRTKRGDRRCKVCQDERNRQRLATVTWPSDGAP